MCVVSLRGKLSEEIDFEVRKKKFDEKKRVNLPLNDSASRPIMTIEIYFNCFQFFLKVLELSDCRRGGPYMTANIGTLFASLTRN